MYMFVKLSDAHFPGSIFIFGGYDKLLQQIDINTIKQLNLFISISISFHLQNKF